MLLNLVLRQGWRLDPLLLFCQLLTAGTALGFALEALRLRQRTQAKPVRASCRPCTAAMQGVCKCFLYPWQPRHCNICRGMLAESRGRRVVLGAGGRRAPAVRLAARPWRAAAAAWHQPARPRRGAVWAVERRGSGQRVAARAAVAGALPCIAQRHGQWQRVPAAALLSSLVHL